VTALAGEAAAALPGSRFLAGAEAAELRWFTPAGAEMTGGDWSDLSALAITLYLDGADDPDRAGT
jgi:isoamylase